MSSEEAILKENREGLEEIASGEKTNSGKHIPTTELKFTVNLKKGFHIRPVSCLARLLQMYDGRIEMSYKKYEKEKGHLEEKKCENPKNPIELLCCELTHSSIVKLKFFGSTPEKKFYEMLHKIFNEPNCYVRDVEDLGL